MRLFSYMMIALLVLATGLTARVNVVTSTTDLAYFAREIGGDHVDVNSIASPKADVHYVEVRPSYMMKIKRADVVFKVGLELDMWMNQLIDGSRNNDLVTVDCSKHIEALEVPTFKADASYGDLHRFGNPHYWLTPDNVKPITDAIVDGLSRVDPEHAEDYRSAQTEYLSELDGDLDALSAKLEQLSGTEVVFYHNSWPYFNAYVGTIAADFVEPYPGVPPSPTHVKELIDLVQSRQIKVIAVEPYFDTRVPEKIASATGANVVRLYPSVGGRDQDESYVQWLEGNLDALLEAAE